MPHGLYNVIVVELVWHALYGGLKAGISALPLQSPGGGISWVHEMSWDRWEDSRFPHPQGATLTVLPTCIAWTSHEAPWVLVTAGHIHSCSFCNYFLILSWFPYWIFFSLHEGVLFTIMCPVRAKQLTHRSFRNICWLKENCCTERLLCYGDEEAGRIAM